MKSNDFYFYVYPELLERNDLTLFEYCVLEILCYKSPKGTFYGSKEEHLAEVLDSSYDYVCRIVRGLIEKGWVKKKRKAIIDNTYDELEVNERWHREINLSSEKQNQDKYYKRFQFFPALMTEAKMTLKQYIVSLTIDILGTTKTSKIAHFAGVCRQTVYNTITKFKDYLEVAQTGVKKLTDYFKNMKQVFTEKAVNKDYRKAVKESRQYQREQQAQYQQAQRQPNPNTAQAHQEAKQREEKIEKFLEEELHKQQQMSKERAAQEETQRKKNQSYCDRILSSS